MSQSAFKLNYVPALDGLRGSAILAVMVIHSGAPFLQGGFIGVDIFFVLSGFLITSSLLSEFDNIGFVSLKNFYMRRILRLGPALISLLTVFCLVSFVMLEDEKANRNYVDALIVLAYISNWARAFSMHPPTFLAHTWSLSIEEQFYIVWPIMLLSLLRVTKKRHFVAAIAVAIAVISWFFRIYLYVIEAVPPERIYNGLDTRADAIMIGCAVGVMLSSGLVSEKISLIKKTGQFSIPCLLVFSIFSRWYDSWMFYYGYFIVELLAAVLILNIQMNSESIIVKILAMRWLVWVGSISYGLYLWHYPVYATMFALGYHGLTVITFGSLISFTLATLSYYFIEKPILKLKKNFIRSTPIANSF